MPTIIQSIFLKAQNKETAFKFVNARISEESQKAKAISLNEGPTNQQVTLSEKKRKIKHMVPLPNVPKQSILILLIVN